MRVLCLQPALPHYRLDFFDRLAEACDGQLQVCYSPTDMGALTDADPRRDWDRPIGKMRRFWPGIEWQSGALGVPLHQADVLIVCGAPRTVSTLLLILRAKVRGIPTLWWGQYWSATSKAWRFRIRMLLMRMVDAVVFYTDAEVAAYRTRFGSGDTRPIGALNNGIAVEPVQAVRAVYDPVERPRTILFVGRLTGKSRLELLLTALSDPRLAGVRLEVIGDGQKRAALESQAQKLAVQVQWRGGITDEAQIAGIANRCRLFCYPGQVGLSLIHAMAYGLPVVIHGDEKTQMPEFAAFDEGESGWSFPAGDSAELAGVLATALEDTHGLRRASATAIARADTTYNTAAMATRMTEMLARVAGTQG